MKKTFEFVILFLLLNQSIAFALERKTDKVTYSIKIHGTLGTYANPPRFEDGRIDQMRLIAELKDIHANTYNWLIRTRNDDLESLKLFLPLARKNKLKIWATLVPPSEPPASEPFKLDYKRWTIELATLSLAEPNLVAWSIDDFTHNLNLFTPEYVKIFLDIARSINPKLAFMPCCYFKQITPSFVTNYGNLLPGILFPYRAESVGANLKDASQVENEIGKLREMFRPKFPIILDIYASGHSHLGASTPQYLQEVLDVGLKVADGILIFRHQDPVKFSVKYQIIKEGFR